MFKREILSELRKWSERTNRKPLILRGARQVGKTTVVNMFARNFEQYIYMNLETAEDQFFFKKINNIEKLIQAIFVDRGKSRKGKKTLIFIDEIQEVPEAIAQLRYFYEDAPELYVIASGSLLEATISNKISYPVGRVEYMVMRPVTFPEFLAASGKNEILEYLYRIPFNSFAHNILLKLFHTYALIGGMPAIINSYIKDQDITQLSPIYESLLTSYIDDIEKYARNESLAHVIRYAISNCFAEAGQRLKFHGFGNSDYSSREMGEALRTIQTALLIHIVYPSTGTSLPILPEQKKAARLHVLDTGLVNYFARLQKEILGSNDLNEVYKGRIAEHIVGQELLAIKFNVFNSLSFWVRDKKGSNAEIDYLYSYLGMLIPVEVKSGTTGTLKSLHQFMDMCSHPYAIRVYSGFFKIDNLITNNGKEFKLMNLPYYMVSQIEKYLEWMINGFNVPSYNGFSDTTNELEDESKIYFEAKKTNNFEDTLIDTVNDTVNKNKNDTVNAVVSDTVNNVKNDTVSDTENDTVNDTVNNTLCDAVNSSVSNSVGDTVKHRLINIVIRVNNKPGIKKQELVKILGVSEVTIKRDMQKLREIVIFLGTQKTGGYYIRKTLLDRLTER